MRSFLKIASQYLLARKLRSLLTAMGVATGAALLFAIMITKQTTVDSFISLVNDISGSSDIQVTGPSKSGFPLSAMDKIKGIKGIIAYEPSIVQISLLKKENRTEKLQLIGVRPATDLNFRDYTFKKGAFLSTSRDKEIIMVQSWADDHGIDLGDKISLASGDGDSTFKVTGLIAAKGVGKAMGGAVGVISLENAQSTFKLPGRASQIDVKARSEGEIPAVIKELKKRLGDSYVVERPAEKGSTVQSSTKGMMDGFDAFSLLALLAGGFVVFNTISLNLSERIKQIGILKLLGATRGQILTLVFIETTILATIGALAGLVLGYFFAKGMTSATGAIYRIPVENFTIPAGAPLTVIAVSLIGSLVAALQPALHIASIKPVAALRTDFLRSKGWLESKGYLLGLFFIFLSVTLMTYSATLNPQLGLLNSAMLMLFVGVALLSIVLISPWVGFFRPVTNMLFKNEGFVAGRNMSRNKTRVALAAITIIMGLSLYISAGEMRLSNKHFVKTWLDSIIQVDLFVRNPVPFDAAQAGNYPRVSLKNIKKIKQIEGVDFVSATTILPTKEKSGKDIFTIFVDPKGWERTSRLELEEGDPKKAIEKLGRGDYAIVSSTVNRKLGIGVGDNFRLKTNDGYKDFKVVGVVAELANNGYSCYLSRASLKKHFGIETADSFNILVKKGYDKKKVRQELSEKIAKPLNFTVISGEDLRADINKSIDLFLALLSSISWIALSISALAIINILSMSVIERKREIGVLRALGATRTQVVKMIMTEGISIGVFGGILGIILGMLMSGIVILISNIDSGLPLKFFIPGEYMAFAFLIALAVSILASIYPAYLASKVNVISAVQYE